MDNRLSEAKPSSTDVQALFNRIAPVYDQLNDQLSFGLHHIWKRMAVKWADPQSGDRVLDLCCGTGDIALLLAEAVGEQGQVYGVDFACDLLAVASERAQKHTRLRPLRSAEMIWQEGDALNLAFADHSFDAATMGYGLRNVADIPQALRELHRVLKPGAKAAILDMNRPTQAMARSLQRWYLETFVVPNATQLGVRDEYVYINPSIERFPIGETQVAIAREAGFTAATHYTLSFGMMGILVVQK